MVNLLHYFVSCAFQAGPHSGGTEFLLRVILEHLEHEAHIVAMNSMPCLKSEDVIIVGIVGTSEIGKSTSKSSKLRATNSENDIENAESV